MTSDINDKKSEWQLNVNAHEIERHCSRGPQFETETHRGARLDEPDLQVDDRTIWTSDDKRFSMRNQDITVC